MYDCGVRSTVATLFFAAFAVFFTDCTPAETPKSTDVALPSPPNAVALGPTHAQSAVNGAFVGAFQGSLGLVWFEEKDGQIAGHAGTTTLRCSGTGELECAYKDHDGQGTAKLHMESNGDLRGEWANGGERGDWLFLRVGPGTEERFEGEYTSEYGNVKLTQQGHDVHGTYPNGTLTCVAQGPHLDCAWDEGGTNGRAMLSRQPNGNLAGTWGDGAEYTGGGAWIMIRK